MPIINFLLDTDLASAAKKRKPDFLERLDFCRYRDFSHDFSTIFIRICFAALDYFI